MDFRNRKISVVGAARSGISAAGVLKQLGAHVLLSDSASEAKLGRERIAEIAQTGVAFAVDACIDTALPPGTELVITSPGVPRNAPVLQTATARNIPVWSEIELAYRLATAPIIATTGTNGKTTTTLLIAHILQQGGYSAIIAGNVSADEIKKTLVDAAFETHQPTRQQAGSAFVQAGSAFVIVAEISSFQLEWVEEFAPSVGVLTNITPDHLNRYSGFEEYAQTKERLFAAQTAKDWAVLNYDDCTVRAFGEKGVTAKRIWVSLEEAPPAPCAYLASDVLTVRLDGDPIPLLHVSEMPASLPGKHSLFNTLAACTVACILGVVPQTITKAVRTFPGAPHRMEFVAEIDGVTYINNSMCTNVAAMIASLSSLKARAIVIAGGADKGLDFTPLTPTLHKHVRKMILIGTAAEKMSATFRKEGYDFMERAETLEDAVMRARHAAQVGEAVILSPGCASFDMFRDFEARGTAFRNAVLAIPSPAVSVPIRIPQPEEKA